MDFPPSKLKSGSGEYVCFVLDRLAEEVLRRRGFSFRRYSNVSPLLYLIFGLGPFKNPPSVKKLNRHWFLQVYFKASQVYLNTSI